MFTGDIKSMNLAWSTNYILNPYNNSEIIQDLQFVYISDDKYSFEIITIRVSIQTEINFDVKI